MNCAKGWAKGLERPLTLPSPTCISCIVHHLDYILNLNCLAHYQDDKKGEVEIVFTGR